MRALVFGVLLSWSFVALQAQSGTDTLKFEEDTHYVVVSDAKTPAPTVTEYFSLFCGHCLQFEGILPDFKEALPEGTTFQKSHVTYLPKDNELVGEGMVRAFVTMEKLGKTEELSKAFFIHIHFEKKEIPNIAEIKNIFLANGVSDEEFEKVYNDPEVISAANAMSQIWLDKRVVSVPTMVVNGKYRINMGSVKNLNQLNSLVKYLLAL